MSSTDFVPGIATETLVCFAGHEWVRPKEKGRPLSCPEHGRYLQDLLSHRTAVPKRLLDLWEETAVLDVPPAYVTRWRKFWERNARILAARSGSWALVDVPALEEYVQHKRLAELHRAYAECDPYQTTTQGSIKPHPGWYLAQVEEKLARQSGIRLGLIAGGERAQEGGGGEPEDDYEVYDDQLGPDGNPL